MTALVVLVALVGLAWAQVWSIVEVAGLVGIGWTLLAMAGCTVGGLWLVSRQGAAVARRARAELLAGRPTPGAGVDGLLLFLAGALLIVPGFVTAALGLLLVLPPVRAVARRPILRWWSRRAERLGGPATGRGPGRFTVRTIVVDGSGPVVPGWERPDRPAASAEIVDVEVHRPAELRAGDPPDGAERTS